jgi:hypothetical protein
MDNYPTSTLTASELSKQVMNDPQATDRERDLAERLAEALGSTLATLALTKNLGRGDRG